MSALRCLGARQGLIFPTFYFIVFQVIASMMLINMFIGAILMSVEEAKDDISNTESLMIKLVKARHLPCVQRNLLLSETKPDPFVRVTVRACLSARCRQVGRWCHLCVVVCS